jgi:hypothetical protein
MSLYPVTKQFIWQMIDNERRLGGPFSLQGAIASYLYDLITGAEISQRNYCKVWGWTHKKVRLNWEQITSTAHLIHANSQGHTRGTTGAQEDAIPDEKQGNGAHEGHNRGTHLQNTTNSNLNLSANLGGGGKPQERVSAHEEPPPAPPDDGPVPFVSDDLEWLPEPDQVYAPEITRILETYRPTAGDQLITHTWRQHSRVPFSSVAALLRDYPWPVFVAGVVIAADDRRPNLKFLNAILRRLNDEYTRPKTAGVHGGPVGVRDGIVIHNIAAGLGRSVPAGVSPGRAGGYQQTSRRNPDFKRPGERSWDEHLRACGVDPSELISDETAHDSEIRPNSSGAGLSNGETLPYRPIVRLRA